MSAKECRGATSWLKCCPQWAQSMLDDLDWSQRRKRERGEAPITNPVGWLRKVSQAALARGEYIPEGGLRIAEAREREAARAAREAELECRHEQRLADYGAAVAARGPPPFDTLRPGSGQASGSAQPPAGTGKLRDALKGQR